jgi:hypothetical protein
MSDTIDVSFRRRNEIIQSIREAESLDAAEKIVDGLERNGWLIMHPNVLPLRTQLADATRKLEEVKAAFYVNMLKCYPEKSHAEIQAEVINEIDRAGQGRG